MMFVQIVVKNLKIKFNKWYLGKCNKVYTLSKKHYVSSGYFK